MLTQQICDLCWYNHVTPSGLEVLLSTWFSLDSPDQLLHSFLCLSALVPCEDLYGACEAMLVCLDAPCLINTVSQKPQFLAGIFSPARICPDQTAPPPGCPCMSIGMTSSTSHLGPKSIGDNLQVGSLVIEVFQTRRWRQMTAI